MSLGHGFIRLYDQSPRCRHGDVSTIREHQASGRTWREADSHFRRYGGGEELAQHYGVRET